MKIAIHKRTGSFSDRWIPYCEENNIPFKVVNCYDSDIISQLNDCDGLMWHWDLTEYKSSLFVRQLTLSLEKKGIKVFPDIHTGWHYEDKLGQKYLLEAINAPFVKSYGFYSKQDALKWIENTSFPKVIKLRTGAGSSNVSLVKNKQKAKQLVKKAFGNGFPHISPISRLKDRFYMLKRDKNLAAVKMVIGGLARLFIYTDIEKFFHREKGYIFFQDFLPNNNFDSRLVVIGDRCFSYRRYTRKGDFRASGSGVYSFDPELTDRKMIDTAFKVADKLGVQSVAFDFIYDKDVPKIVEISYCFCMGHNSVDYCTGNWDRNLTWHKEDVKPQIFMIEYFLKSLKKGNE
jgi:glutathione synthase/RimK-type ligase-like ATP-grasp enzyme